MDNFHNKTTLESYKPKIISMQKDLAKISIIGEGLLSNSDYVAKIYNLAVENSVHIEMITFSELSISVVVSDNQAKEFANLIHDEIIE